MPILLLNNSTTRGFGITESSVLRSLYFYAATGEFSKGDEKQLEIVLALTQQLITLATLSIGGVAAFVFQRYNNLQGGRGKLNVVLFHKAARVQSLDIPKGTAIDAQLYEYDDAGIDIHPWVWEQIPPKPTAPEVLPIRLEPEDLLVSEVLDSSTPEDYDDERRDLCLSWTSQTCKCMWQGPWSLRPIHIPFIATGVRKKSLRFSDTYLKSI